MCQCSILLIFLNISQYFRTLPTDLNNCRFFNLSAPVWTANSGNVECKYYRIITACTKFNHGKFNILAVTFVAVEELYRLFYVLLLSLLRCEQYTQLSNSSWEPRSQLPRFECCQSSESGSEKPACLHRIIAAILDDFVE